ncbi:GIY-YIG nuclease family protein [Candidatus Parcubacteria bacterium]|nr:GIY-YIG nuclease family protein [Candidatus Omnitrophota bacterium]MCG2689356.1 GIY-YIG nuclease family protein [Candidatus Parcubacteria bacterium]
MAYVYILKCSDGSYYTGSTKDLVKRIRTHKSGKVKYTKSRLPVDLVFVKELDNYSLAFIFESKVKSWKKRKSIERMLQKSDNVANKYWGVV